MPSFLTRAYDQVYYASELRAQRKLAGGEAGLSEEHKESLHELKTPGQRVQRFFGLPAGDSLAGVAQNFLFWRSNRSKWQNVLWGISLLVVVPVQLSLVVFKCLRNILKLVTEFLPLLLRDSFFRVSRSINVVLASEASNPVKVVVFLAWIFVILPLWIASGLCYFIGRATTSPVESVRASFEFGKSKHPVLGVLLAGLSVAVTACIYAILFPLAIKFLLVQAAAALPSFPQWVMSMFFSIAKLGFGFGQFLFSHLPLSFLTSFCSPIIISVMAGLSLVGLTLFGSGTAVGAVVDRVTDPGTDDPGINRRECIEYITSGEQITGANYKHIFAHAPGDDVIPDLQNSQDGKIPAIAQLAEL